MDTNFTKQISQEDFSKMFAEEDFFPHLFAAMEVRDWGVMFYDEENKQSYDSNHAVIFKDKVKNLSEVLDEIAKFYKAKNINPNIYEATADEGYFLENRKTFESRGYCVFEENHDFMVLCDENKIAPNPDIAVERVTEWSGEIEEGVFLAAGEPWEIGVAKKMIARPECHFFVALDKSKKSENANRPIGMSYIHTACDVCRFDYILIATEYRGKGVARSILHALVEYCKSQKIANCFQWPANETSAKICEEAGFRSFRKVMAGRAGMQ